MFPWKCCAVSNNAKVLTSVWIWQSYFQNSTSPFWCGDVIIYTIELRRHVVGIESIVIT